MGDETCNVCGEPKSAHVATAQGPLTHPREARGEGTYRLVSHGGYSDAFFPGDEGHSWGPTYEFVPAPAPSPAPPPDPPKSELRAVTALDSWGQPSVVTTPVEYVSGDVRIPMVDAGTGEGERCGECNGARERPIDPERGWFEPCAVCRGTGKARP